MVQEVLRQPAKAAIFLVLDVRPGSEDTARDLLADLPGLTADALSQSGKWWS